jgi:hypothetical protein
MADKQLLKEAIAEAKTIKEVAIANAKAALEETFSPVLKEKLAAMMEEDEMDEADTMDEAKDEMEEGKDMEEAYHTEEGMDEGEDMDEASLEELLAELENEMSEGEDMDEAKEMDEAEEVTEAEEIDEAEGDEAGDDIDLEEMSEDELKDFVEEVIADMVQAGELEAGGDPVEMSDEEEEEGEEEMEMDSMDEEVNIDELLSEEEVNEEDMDEGIKDTLKKVYNDPEIMGKIITVDGKKVSLKDLLQMAGGSVAGSMAGGGKGTTRTPGSGDINEKEMEEMKKELDELKVELSEVNLLNAKLLYTNKLFRSRSLTESQKVKVLSTFDKATSVKEVKLVFETLSDSLTTSQVVKENKGSASRPTGGASKNPQPILESNDQVRRWQKLAGIITDKSYR